MPVFERDDAEIHYEVFGSGYPVLLFAPGGMRSRLDMWHSPAGRPPRYWCDWTEILASRYRVVAMDQRNAGASRGEIAADHGWHTYAADQLALMDHLGLDRFHVLGCCIGASFCLTLAELAPERLNAVVLQNPIGVDPKSPTFFPDAFAEWSAEQLERRPGLDASTLASFGRNMFDHDFVFSVTRDFARRCAVRTLVLPGNDTPHPAAAGNELAEILPDAECVVDWKGPDHLDVQRRVVTGFLDRYTA